MTEAITHPAVDPPTRHHLKCERCGKEWDAYVPNPKVCRFCKNPAWNVPKDAVLACPVAACSYTATGARARVQIVKHVQNTEDDDHGTRYEIPADLRQRLAEILGTVPDQPAA